MLDRRENGIALMELIVVMVLLATAMAMVAGFLMSSLRGAQQTVGNGRAQADSGSLLELLASDVRQASSRRGPDHAAYQSQMRNYVRSGNPSFMGSVRMATSNELRVLTDAIADANANLECVHYVATATSVIRRVYVRAGGLQNAEQPWNQCGDNDNQGTLAEETLILRTADSFTGPRFTYVLEFNPDLSGDGVVNASNCRIWRDVVLPGGPTQIPPNSRLPAIIGVQVNGTAHFNGGAQQFGPRSSYSIMSRRTSTYRQALGCSS
jgi:Tfp pilus assembly protein PilV